MSKFKDRLNKLFSKNLIDGCYEYVHSDIIVDFSNHNNVDKVLTEVGLGGSAEFNLDNLMDVLDNSKV